MVFQRQLLLFPNLRCTICSQRTKSLLPLQQGARFLNASASLEKSRGPKTVGVMSWVRAAARRKYLEQQMRDKVKSKHELVKEELLDRSDALIEFRTTNRVGEILNEIKMHSHLNKPAVFLSNDKQTVICYHPPPAQYPESYTKRAVAPSLFHLKPEINNTFKGTMTTEEIEEAVKLREFDPKLWTVKSLAKLLKVKTDTIMQLIPITESQRERVKAESEMVDQMSVMKRRQHKEIQEYERLKYIRETRGKDFSRWYTNLEKIRKPKVFIPPKL